MTISQAEDFRLTASTEYSVLRIIRPATPAVRKSGT